MRPIAMCSAALHSAVFNSPSIRSAPLQPALVAIIALSAAPATSAPVAGASLAQAIVASPEPLEPCNFGERSASAPEELDQFSFLIGNWDIETQIRSQDGTWGKSRTRAYWEGRWILGGTAISDYWYDSPPSGEGDPPGRGMNVRFFRQDLGTAGQWMNMWQHSRLSEIRTLISEVRDDGLMHMWATSPDTSKQRRMHFVVESDDAWHRVEERSFDTGESWVEVARIFARRAGCPWKPPG